MNENRTPESSVREESSSIEEPMKSGAVDFSDLLDADWMNAFEAAYKTNDSGALGGSMGACRVNSITSTVMRVSQLKGVRRMPAGMLSRSGLKWSYLPGGMHAFAGHFAGVRLRRRGFGLGFPYLRGIPGLR